MSNRPKVKATQPPPKKHRSAAEVVTKPLAPKGSRLDAAQGGSANRTWWIVGAVAIVVAIALIVVLASGDDQSAKATAPKSATELVSKVTSIGASTYDAVGAGSVDKSIGAITDAKALTADGKPLVVYIGAEYCPFCAAERWPMVMALSRFGTFKDLGVSHSSGTDVYPNTPTFTFHGSTYTSDYLSFQGVETLSNEPEGQSYKKLDTLTSAQEALIGKFDAPPYVDSSSAGAIPFVDIGNKYVISGATYSPEVLQGRSADSIAAALTDTSTDISKGAVGSANVITAAICKITGEQPAKVCDSAGVKAATAKL